MVAEIYNKTVADFKTKNVTHIWWLIEISGEGLSSIVPSESSVVICNKLYLVPTVISTTAQ